MTQVTTAVYAGGARIDAAGAAGDARSARAAARDAGGFAWVSIVDDDTDRLAQIVAEVGVHPVAARELARTHQRSLFERYGDDAFVVLQPATYDDAAETVRCDEVDVVLVDGMLITATRSGRLDLESIRRRLDDHPHLIARGPHAILWAMFETVLAGYRDVLDGVENDIDEIEDQLFGDDPAVSRRIFDLQREAIDLAHATTPLPDVLERLGSWIALDGAETPGWTDLRGRAAYVSERVQAMRRTLDDALTIHATLVNQRLDEKMADLTEVQVRQNEQVKKISSWAAIGFAPTFVASLYGMNFRYMPELDLPWGYPMAIGFMVLLSAGLYVVFKRNDWL
ncbi:magnesium and cobalt transport protein CorA [Microbacterium radiodurans]|uniref:Magnesium and cobalt transport protein CorA n=1 Tax=Microbacterium radiodurans TaxID=661398 RepID=A0A5J5ISJ5_9MICO|nr:magnesium and cobalt transport protein CorA [Microbacterium radiodurans]KAA9086603.1 magnesium and cobalt transport protein CorA [Microbacterium radiodurans]